MHVALPNRVFPCLVPVNIQSKSPPWLFVIQFLGGLSERDPPVPIPNTAVKPLSPDGTARASVWESRKLPGLKPKAPVPRWAFFYCLEPRTPPSRCLLPPHSPHGNGRFVVVLAVLWPPRQPPEHRDLSHMRQRIRDGPLKHPLRRRSQRLP